MSSVLGGTGALAGPGPSRRSLGPCGYDKGQRASSGALVGSATRNSVNAAVATKVERKNVAKPLEDWTVLWPKHLVQDGEEASSSAPATQLEPPSCPYFGPIDGLSKSSMERLYTRAKDMYYDGRPIVADAVFDELELRLRQMRSSVVRKYPRCSLHRSGPMYADADEDPSQQWALRCIWRVLAAGGMALTSIPLATAIHAHLATTPGSMSAPPSLAMAAASLLSLAVGFPVVSTCLEACRKMSSGHTHAVRGQCPSCGEDVFAFLSSEGRPVRPDGRAFLREHAECHVCDQKLEFRAFFVNRDGVSTEAKDGPVPAKDKWVYGRVYARHGVSDLAPKA